MRTIAYLALLAVAAVAFIAVDGIAAENDKNKAKVTPKAATASPVLKGMIVQKIDPATKEKAYYLRTSEYGDVLLPDPKALNPNSVITLDDYKRFLNKSVVFTSKFEKNKDNVISIKEITNIKLITP